MVTMARHQLLGGVVTLCLLTACSNPTPGLAFVRGYLVWPVGRLPQQFRPEPTAGLVSVFQNGHVMAQVNVSKTGRFTVEIPPGSYSLTAVPTGGLPGICSAGYALHARSGKVTSVDVDCHLAPGPAPG